MIILTDRPQLFVVLAASAVALAIAAFVATFWQAAITRRHLRLSLRPILIITAALGGASIKITVANRGLGPAIIVNFHVFLDRELIPGEGFVPLVDALARLHIPAVELNLHPLLKGSVITAGESVEIVAIPEPGEKRGYINDNLPRVNMIVTYCSLYGERFREGFAPKAWKHPNLNTAI